MNIGILIIIHKYLRYILLFMCYTGWMSRYIVHWEILEREILNSKDEFLQVAAGNSNEIEIVDEINFSLFRDKEGIE